jgi:hypothetical protein
VAEFALDVEIVLYARMLSGSGMFYIVWKIAEATSIQIEDDDGDLD